MENKVIAKEYVDKNYIELDNNTVSKDKIRKKISVLEKIQSEFTNNEELRIKIITLKDLLLEEE